MAISGYYYDFSGSFSKFYHMGYWHDGGKGCFKWDFAICILLEIVIMISMTAALSDFANRIKILTQNIAILENRIRKLEEQIKYESKKQMKQRMSQQRNKRQCH